MKKRLLALFFTFIAAVIAVYFLFSPPIEEHQPKVAAPQQTRSANPIADTDPVTPHKKTKSEPHTTQNHIESLQLGTQSKMIADAYAKEITFPPYSKPLSIQDKGLLKPNHFVPVSFPLKNGDSLSLALSKFRFIFPEPIQFTLHSSNGDHLSATVELVNSITNEILLTQPLSLTQGSGQTTIAGDQAWPTELILKVSINELDSKQPITALFQYVSPVAEIVSVGERYPDEADIVIPVSLDVTKAGLYRLRANLYSKKNQPIAILTGQEKLDQGIQTLPLKVHKSVLNNHEGPYELTTFQLEKRSASPGELTEYGTSQQDSYVIESIALSLLSDDPYQPSENELKRLQFLEKMAESP